MRKLFIGLLVFIGIIAIVGTILGILMIQCFKEQTAVQNMEINDINIELVKNGRYWGNFTYGNFMYKVEVLVADRRIQDIKIISNRDSEHAKKAEEVLQRVVNEQSLDVDAVTGATTTSKALLKATENALNKGIQ